MVMEVAADKRNLDDTLINVSIITITTSNHKDFESALYELVKFPIVLNWTNSEEGFSTTVIHFPKRLNQSEERKLVSFLKVLRRKVKFEWNIEVAKIPQDDDFWIYSDLLNYIKRNYREYYEVQNICEFNEPTAVRITKLVLHITEKKQIGETTVYRRKSLGFPPTLTVKSHRGIKLHYKVEINNIIKKQRFELNTPRVGVDLLAEGSIDILPPSKHPSGVSYEFIRQIPPSFLPEAKFGELLEKLRDKDAKEKKADDSDSKENIKQTKDSTDFDVQPFVELLKPYWTEGHRHTLALGLGGLFYYAKRPINEVKTIVKAVCAETGGG